VAFPCGFRRVCGPFAVRIPGGSQPAPRGLGAGRPSAKTGARPVSNRRRGSGDDSEASTTEGRQTPSGVASYCLVERERANSTSVPGRGRPSSCRSCGPTGSGRYSLGRRSQGVKRASCHPPPVPRPRSRAEPRLIVLAARTDCESSGLKCRALSRCRSAGEASRLGLGTIALPALHPTRLPWRAGSTAKHQPRRTGGAK
jgi:hypothetical protein